MSHLFASGGQSIGASASASVLPVNIGGGFLYWTSLLALVVKTLPVNAADIRDAGSKPGKMLWKRAWQPTPVFLGFPCGSGGKESACNVGNLGLIPELGRSPGEGKSYPL